MRHLGSFTTKCGQEVSVVLSETVPPKPILWWDISRTSKEHEIQRWFSDIKGAYVVRNEPFQHSTRGHGDGAHSIYLIAGSAENELGLVSL